jgi:hypothetical protein
MAAEHEKRQTGRLGKNMCSMGYWKVTLSRDKSVSPLPRGTESFFCYQNSRFLQFLYGGSIRNSMVIYVIYVFL